MEVGELGHGGALPAGDDQRADALQLLRLPYLHSLHPEPPKRCDVFVERSLESEDADRHLPLRGGEGGRTSGPVNCAPMKEEKRASERESEREREIIVPSP